MTHTDEEKSEWRRRFVRRIMDKAGVDESIAQAEYEAALEFFDYDDSPEDAADEALSYWEDDGS